MATQSSVAGEILNIPLVNIIPSKTNPRGIPSPEGLEDLATDIERRGVQQAIVVRPAKADGKYEIVFGERRFRASGQAKRETIPCVVRRLSDDDAYEAQVIENLLREDLHPLDEAAAFQRLYDQIFKDTKHHDETIKLVALRVSKKRTPELIAQRLKLGDLDPAAKTAFREGDLLLGHANELARLRSAEQKAALAWLLQRAGDLQTPQGWKKARVMASVPELRLWIQQNLFLDLTKAPFDTTSATLNSTMGPCTSCQFKTGNQPALFADVQKDEICTSPRCWTIKRDTHLVQIAKARAKELGVKSILKVGFGHPSWNRTKVPVDLYIEYNSGARIVKNGKECKDTQAGIITWFGHASDAEGFKVGDPVLVCQKAADCLIHKHVDSRAKRTHKTFEQMADTRLANLRQEAPQRERAALIAAVIESAIKQEAQLSRRHPVMFQRIADQMHKDLFFDRHRDLCKILGAEPDLDRYKNKDWRGTSGKIFKGNPVALMVAMTIMHAYHVGSGDRGADPLKDFVRLYRVNAQEIEKRVKASVAEKITAIQQALKKRKVKKGEKVPAGA